MNHQRYAHTRSAPDGSALPEESWQPLDEHLRNVASLAARFAEPFGGAEWARVAGLWHDLGKHSEAFQRYLRSAQDECYHSAELRGKVDHTSAGAQHAVGTMGILGHVLAFAIAGHHAGLLDAIGEGASLERRLKKSVDPWQVPPPPGPHVFSLGPPSIVLHGLAKRTADQVGAAFSVAFFTRMLFSCLVDSDFLDTEAFMDPSRAARRPVWPEDIVARMEGELARFMRRFDQTGSVVQRERQRVHEACLAAATQSPGLFSLTVPTGGGKTLSSLAFALRHAREHGLRRVVYVAPFTSIIEQNADVFRAVFAALRDEGLHDPVLEHHSAVDVGEETFESRLASESWDAPLVVTTSVQFYESLFAARTSRCRKLHNLARAVVILDEVQKLPVDFLKPCLLALRELAESYGATILLCTATQPALHRRSGFCIGLEGIREIAPDPAGLYLVLKRVEATDLGVLDDATLSSRLAVEGQALCVVNTRRHARELFERLDADTETIHLSAAMCPAHRSEVIAEVRARLAGGSPCRVVSTQLVEAGVDLDFPVVFRSLAGLDSIAQAAGRCNRNGTRSTGQLYLFRSDRGREEAFLRDTANAAEQILGGGSNRPLYDDPLSLEAVEHYFRLYYWDQQQRWDARDILGLLKLGTDRGLPFLFCFRTIAERFRLIDDAGRPVVVPWGEEARSLCEELRNPWAHPDVQLLRALQRYTVQVPRRVWDRALGRSVELVRERYAVLCAPDLHYDPRLGLRLDVEQFEPASLMI